MKAIEKLPKISGIYRENASISNMTWFNVGGKADILFKPADVNDLISFIKKVKLPTNIIGVGSNLIVRDSGIKGVLIKFGRNFTNISCNNNTITVGCAALLSNLAKFALSNDISGFEFFIGIPGTVGGAIAMNAGAYGHDTASILKAVKAVDEYGKVHLLTKDDIGYYYRGNNLQGQWIFIEAIFNGIITNSSLISNKMIQYMKKRADSQPIRGKTGGSTFKNPIGYQAWQLIKDSGCHNLSCGGARVSEKHCNFLLNYNNATAADLENLGNEIIRKVKDKFNITLEWEIKFLG